MQIDGRLVEVIRAELHRLCEYVTRGAQNHAHSQRRDAHEWREDDRGGDDYQVVDIGGEGGRTEYAQGVEAGGHHCPDR